MQTKSFKTVNGNDNSNGNDGYMNMNVNRKVTLDDLEIIDMITAQNEKTSRLLNDSQHGPAMHHHITRNNSNPKSYHTNVIYIVPFSI